MTATDGEDESAASDSPDSRLYTFNSHTPNSLIKLRARKPSHYFFPFGRPVEQVGQIDFM